MKLTFPAWNNERYLSLAELLLLIGRFFINCEWYLRVEEVAPEPGAELLEKIDPKEPIDIFTLLHLVTPEIQIVDGTVVAVELGSHEISLVLRAIDSTSWEIESEKKDIEAIIREKYPDAQQLD